MKGQELNFLLKLNPKQFFSASKQAQKSYTELYKDIEKRPLKMQSSGTAQLLKQFVGIGAVFMATRKVFEDMKTSQVNFANVASLGVDNIEELRKGVQKIGLETPVALHDMEKGLYDVVSAGVDASNRINVLEQSARAAKAGLAETSDALNLGSAVIKGYGKTWGAFEGIMDQAFQTVKLGQTTFPELAQSVGKVIPLAATLGVETETLFGAMATLTGVTGNAAEVSTQLRGVMAATVKPTAELTELFSDYGSAQNALKELGLAEYLKQMSERTGGNVEAMTKLVPRVEGLNAVLALSGSQFDTFIEKTAAMKDSAGAMTGAFEKQAETLDSKLTQLDNTFQIFSAQILNGVVPPLTELIELLSSIMGYFAKLDPEVRNTQIGFAALTIVLIKLPAIINSIRVAILGLNASLGPAGWIILGITAAAAAVEYFGDSSEKAARQLKIFREEVQALTESETRNKISDLEIALTELAKKREQLIKDIEERNKKSLGTGGGILGLRPGDVQDTKALSELGNQIDMTKSKIDALENKLKTFNNTDLDNNNSGTDTPTAAKDKPEYTTEIELKDLKLQTHQEYLAQRRELDTQFYTDSYSDLLYDYEQKQAIAEQNLLAAEINYGKDSEEYRAAAQQKIEVEANYQRAKQELAAEGARATIALGAQLMGAFQGNSRALFNIGKAAAKANATINAYQAMGRAYKDYPWPFNLGVAAVQLALGMAQVTKINSVNFKGKKDGGMITATDIASSAFTPSGEHGIIGIRRGEYVMNEHSTAQFLPLLEQMNARGNIPGYASGGQVNEVATPAFPVTSKQIIEVQLKGTTIELDGQIIKFAVEEAERREEMRKL